MNKNVNIFAGILEELSKIYLFACKPLSANPSNSAICTIMDDNLKKMNVAGGNVLLLLSGTARFLIRTAQTLKVAYPRLLQVTCTAHLRHICAKPELEMGRAFRVGFGLGTGPGLSSKKF